MRFVKETTLATIKRAIRDADSSGQRILEVILTDEEWNSLGFVGNDFREVSLPVVDSTGLRNVRLYRGGDFP